MLRIILTVLILGGLVFAGIRLTGSRELEIEFDPDDDGEEDDER